MEEEEEEEEERTLPTGKNRNKNSFKRNQKTRFRLSEASVVEDKRRERPQIINS
jgi:hypothetical protein